MVDIWLNYEEGLVEILNYYMPQGQTYNNFEGCSFSEQLKVVGSHREPLESSPRGVLNRPFNANR